MLVALLLSLFRPCPAPVLAPVPVRVRQAGSRARQRLPIHRH